MRARDTALLAALLLRAAPLLAAAPAAAERLSLSAAAGAHWVRDRGIDPLIDHDVMPAVRLSAGWHPARVGPVRVGAEAGYDLSADTGTMFETIETEVALHGATAGLHGEWPVGDTLRLFARAGGGAYWANVVVRDDAGTLSDWSLAPGGYATGGAALAFRPGGTAGGGRFTLDRIVLSAEAGELFLAAHGIDGARGSSERLSTRSADLGTLRLSGTLFRLGLALRF